jgi:NAD(P)-dependent dehydrogenase (short-subunit alcohol dehydrogenase family)
MSVQTNSGLLDGAVAVVTGAARGNGEGIARGLAAEGAAVAVADLDQDVAAKVCDEINDAGGQARPYRVDVADDASCRTLAAQVHADIGPISVLVNNAGILSRALPGSPGYLADVRRQLAVNLLGTVAMIDACVGDLRATRGCIVNVGSTASFRAAPAASGYAASKGGVLQLTKTLAVDLAPDGIRVNAVAPSLFETAMTVSMRQNPETVRKLLDRTPLGRFGRPEDLAGPVVFLCSAMSAYVTGSTILVDGGLLTG